MKNYLIKNTRGVEIFVNTDAPNDGREGIITSIQGLDVEEIRDFGFIYGVGDIFDEGTLENYARSRNFSITSLNQDNEVDDLFTPDTEFRFTITTTSASTVFTLPATSAENNFVVDWGDTNTETITSASPTHTYATADTYQIQIIGYMPVFAFADTGTSKDLVVSLDNMGDTGLENMNDFMEGCENMTSANLNNFGAPSAVIRAFNGCTSLVTVNSTTFVTSRIQDWNGCFNNCNALTTIDCSAWDMSNSINLRLIFARCTVLVNLALEHWDLSNCESLSQAFLANTTATTWDMGLWDVSKCRNFEFMFWRSTALTSLPLANWDMSSATTINQMFSGCSSLTDIPATSWDTSNVTNFEGVITGCSVLTFFNVANWDVSSGTTFRFFAEDGAALTNLPVANWRFGDNVNLSRFLDNCDAIVTLNVRNWNVEAVRDWRGFAQNSASLTNVDTSLWQTRDGALVDSIFRNCVALTSRMNPAAFWENTTITSFANAFQGATLIENFSDIPGNWRGNPSPVPPPDEPLPLPPDA